MFWKVGKRTNETMWTSGQFLIWIKLQLCIVDQKTLLVHRFFHHGVWNWVFRETSSTKLCNLVVWLCWPRGILVWGIKGANLSFASMFLPESAKVSRASFFLLDFARTCGDDPGMVMILILILISTTTILVYQVYQSILNDYKYIYRS